LDSFFSMGLIKWKHKNINELEEVFFVLARQSRALVVLHTIASIDKKKSLLSIFNERKDSPPCLSYISVRARSITTTEMIRIIDVVFFGHLNHIITIIVVILLLFLLVHIWNILSNEENKKASIYLTYKKKRKN